MTRAARLELWSRLGLSRALLSRDRRKRCYVWLTILEHQLETHLKDSRIPNGRDLTEIARREGAADAVELRVVEEVEPLGSDLQPASFAQ